MVEDAGNMIADAGTSMQDGSVPPTMAQEVSCNKSASERLDEGENGARTITFRWAEFDVDAGVTEVTICHRGDPDGYQPQFRKDWCFRGGAQWLRGTSTGLVSCGIKTDWDNDETFTDSDSPDPLSITVHR